MPSMRDAALRKRPWRRPCGRDVRRTGAATAGEGAPSKPVVIGRYGPVTADQARRKAPELLGKVAGGNDPTVDRAEARGMPTLGGVFEGYMAANPKRTNELYRYEATARKGARATATAQFVFNWPRRNLAISRTLSLHLADVESGLLSPVR